MMKENIKLSIFKDKTDAGNAEVFSATYSRVLRWVSEMKSFLFWTGKKWERVSESFVLKIVLRFGKLQVREASNKSDAKWATYTRSKSGILAIKELIKPKLLLSVRRLNRNKDFLNTQNGILHLPTLTLHKHNPRFYCTEITNSKFIRNSIPPKIFRNSLFYLVALPKKSEKYAKSENSKRMRFVRRIFAIAFSGRILEQIFPIIAGKGATGKSTIMELLSYLFGSYASKMFVKAFAGKYPAHSDLARIDGKRFISVSETDEDLRLNSATLKSLTGGDTQTGRFLYKDWFNFSPQASFFLHTNNEPSISDRSYGMWRRVKLIKSNWIVPEKNRDNDFLEKLKAKSDEIFSWIVTDFPDYLKQGLVVPESIKADTEGYEKETDPLIDLLDIMELDPDREKNGENSSYVSHVKHLKSLHDQLVIETGEKRLTENKISRLFGTRGFARGRATIQGRNDRAIFGLRPKDAAPKINSPRA